MDVATRPPHEVTGSSAAFRIFQRSFEHESLFERRVLVQRHDCAGRHLEQDGRASFVVLVQDLHLDSVEVSSLPRHRRRGDEGRPKFGRVDGQRLVHGFFSGIVRDRAAFQTLTTKRAKIERRCPRFESTQQYGSSHITRRNRPFFLRPGRSGTMLGRGQNRASLLTMTGPAVERRGASVHPAATAVTATVCPQGRSPMTWPWQGRQL